ncbi:putative calcium-binding protein CML19, partial [Mucuna pruriens]
MRMNVEFLKYLDEDGDGKISPSELRKGLGMMGGELLLKEVEMLIEELDSDGDGLLSMEDIAKVMEATGEEDKLKDLAKAFEMYNDSKLFGFITPKSLQKMLARLGESKSLDQCTAMIGHFDLNDNTIALQEVIHYMYHLKKKKSDMVFKLDLEKACNRSRIQTGNPYTWQRMGHRSHICSLHMMSMRLDKSLMLCIKGVIRQEKEHLKNTTQIRFTEHINKMNVEFERVLRHFDEDGDGKISPSELRKRLGMMGRELLLKEVEMLIEELDSDGDGLLSLEDFVKVMEAAGEEDKLRDLEEAFEMYNDSEMFGFITPKSLQRMLARLGESKSMEQCRAMIDHFDLNGDGLLCFDEFQIMMG